MKKTLVQSLSKLRNNSFICLEFSGGVKEHFFVNNVTILPDKGISDLSMVRLGGGNSFDHLVLGVYSACNCDDFFDVRDYNQKFKLYEIETSLEEVAGFLYEFFEGEKRTEGKIQFHSQKTSAKT